jgi:UDP-N-acetylmuramyl pentapeptide phosphotransferase/UDP-N-acetylglucosamine-1-phosphate transferase
VPIREVAVAFALSLALTPAFRAAARRGGLVDRPNARSSHERLVPRGGGAAIVAATLLALWLGRGAWSGQPGAVGILLGAGVLASIGFWDDRRGLSPFVRLAVQVAVASGVVWLVGGIERLPLPAPLDLPLGPAAGAATVVWLVGVVNFFNFLDGIDGLATVQAVVTAAGVALAGWDPLAALLGAAVAGAAAGFLPFNWSPASVFLGDVGSYFLGYTLAALPLSAPPGSRSQAVLFVALSLWLFLADAAWTLARRARRGARWYEAHREHIYQQLALRQGHSRVAASIGLGSLALTAGALAARRSGEPLWTWAVLALAVALFGGQWALARSGRAA